MMYTKLQAGDAYDILIPSDYMIERLIREDYLQPIDWDRLTNAEGLNPDVMNKEYDPGNVYSVPYSGVMWVFYMTRPWWIRRTSVKAGIC